MSTLSQSRILRPNELAEKLGVSRTTLWRWERQGLLPPRVSVGPNTRGWLAETIDRFWSQRTEGSSPSTAEESA